MLGNHEVGARIEFKGNDLEQAAAVNQKPLDK
jgi:hypothetical protein